MIRIRRAMARSLLAAIAVTGIGLMAVVSISCNGPSSPGNTQGRPHIPTEAETRAENRLNAAKRFGMPELYVFLKPFPKGADLHVHLSGAVYAETLIKDGAADNLCVDQKTFGFVKSTGHARNATKSPVCPSGAVAVSSAFKDQHLYDSMVDAFSMRSFVATPGVSGHDQFFSTFDRFLRPDVDSLDAHSGEWLDEVATRAAMQNEQYMEIMQTPSFFELQPLWTSLGWPATSAGTNVDPEGDVTGTSPAELSALRAKLLAGGLGKEAALDEKELDTALAQRDAIEHCGKPNAVAACGVKIRYLYQVLRAYPPQQVFAQTLLAFEVASADPNVVGLNFVQPEDSYLAMSEYNRQMRMLDYLHSVYPKVHISLHAGELAPGLVPPDGLAFHIRKAIELGHAERIGHGVDVLYEDRPFDLMKEMADRHVDVEINLTSNDGILGVKGGDHPLAAYMAAHVPFSLSTDDEGVSRIDLTHEYARAVEEQNLSYIDLKHSARDSLEHSFLPGQGLWAAPDDYEHMNSACSVTAAANSKPADACQQFLNANEKAAQQWELERRFAAFEAGVR